MTLTIETSKGKRDFEGDGPIRIGRDPSAEVVSDNPNVSRFHAEVRGERRLDAARYRIAPKAYTSTASE